MSTEKENILAQWLEGQLTSDEEAQLQNTMPLAQLQQHIERLDKLTIGGDSIDKNWSDFNKRLHQKPKIINKIWAYVAVVCLSSIVALGLYMYSTANKPTKITTTVGQKYAGILPDSSSISLNALSSVSYNPTTWDDNRQVNLSGQAYFEVKKGSAFDVITTNGHVLVLGTKFDVESYGKSITVTCYEGKVSVSSLSGDQRILSAHQKIQLYDQIFTEIRPQTDNSPSWKNDVLKIENMPLPLLLEELKKYYNISVSISKANENKHFSGYVPTNDLTKALDLISLPLDLKYTIEGQMVKI